MALVHGEETLYSPNDIPDRMEKMRQAGSTLLPLELRAAAIEALRIEQKVKHDQQNMVPWEACVGKQGWFQFATPVIQGMAPGAKQHEATNVVIGRCVAVLGSTVAIEYALPVDYEGKRAFYRGYVPAQAIVSFLEVASETNAPAAPDGPLAPVILIRP